MTSPTEGPTGYRVPHQPPSRPGIKFVICAALALGGLLLYAFYV